jgi:hypothetical protein
MRNSDALCFCLAHSLKMFQWEGQMDKQAAGVPFVEDLAAKMMNDDLACELAAESFSIRITVDRWPTLLLPRPEHEEPRDALRLGIG